MSKPLMERFLLATPFMVAHWFASLPRAQRSTKRSANGAPMWVYVEGALPAANRLLLVAHMDTVSNTPPSAVQWMGNIAKIGYSKITVIGDKKDKDGKNWKDDWHRSGGYGNYRTCLGADDRAGCAMLWAYRNSGHSLLICNEEESGGAGARAAVADLRDQLAAHLFAIQIDRRGDQNYVYYRYTATDAFADFIEATLPRGWLEMTGSFSDIATICPEVGICGLNMAAGFLNEHSSSELFFLDAWQRTHNAIGALMRGAKRKYTVAKPPPPPPKAPPKAPAGASAEDARNPKALPPARGGFSKDEVRAFGLWDYKKCPHPHVAATKVYPGFLFCYACSSYNTVTGDAPAPDEKPISWEDVWVDVDPVEAEGSKATLDGDDEAYRDWWKEREAANNAALRSIGD